MRSFLRLLFPGLLVLLVALACKKPEPAACTFSYDPAGTDFKWTAYKFTEKTGVSGGFNAIEVTGTKSGATVEAVLAGLKFTIRTDSVNSGNETRDPKIRDAFFNSLKPAGTISGAVKSMNAGQAVVAIALNGQEQDVPMSYTVNETGLFEAKGEINVNDWGAQPAVVALNKVCEDLHKGKDGSSKLWPDVSLSVKTTLKKNCP